MQEMISDQNMSEANCLACGKLFESDGSSGTCPECRRKTEERKSSRAKNK